MQERLSIRSPKQKFESVIPQLTEESVKLLVQYYNQIGNLSSKKPFPEIDRTETREFLETFGLPQTLYGFNIVTFSNILSHLIDTQRRLAENYSTVHERSRITLTQEEAKRIAKTFKDPKVILSILSTIYGNSLQEKLNSGQLELTISNEILCEIKILFNETLKLISENLSLFKESSNDFKLLDPLKVSYCLSRIFSQLKKSNRLPLLVSSDAVALIKFQGAVEALLIQLLQSLNSILALISDSDNAEVKAKPNPEFPKELLNFLYVLNNLCDEHKPLYIQENLHFLWLLLDQNCKSTFLQSLKEILEGSTAQNNIMRVNNSKEVLNNFLTDTLNISDLFSDQKKSLETSQKPASTEQLPDETVKARQELLANFLIERIINYALSNSGLSNVDISINVHPTYYSNVQLIHKVEKPLDIDSVEISSANLNSLPAPEEPISISGRLRTTHTIILDSQESIEAKTQDLVNYLEQKRLEGIIYEYIKEIFPKLKPQELQAFILNNLLSEITISENSQGKMFIIGSRWINGNTFRKILNILLKYFNSIKESQKKFKSIQSILSDENTASTFVERIKNAVEGYFQDFADFLKQRDSSLRVFKNGEVVQKFSVTSTEEWQNSSESDTTQDLSPQTGQKPENYILAKGYVVPNIDLNLNIFVVPDIDLMIQQAQEFLRQCS